MIDVNLRVGVRTIGCRYDTPLVVCEHPRMNRFVHDHSGTTV